MKHIFRNLKLHGNNKRKDEKVETRPKIMEQRCLTNTNKLQIIRKVKELDNTNDDNNLDEYMRLQRRKLLSELKLVYNKEN